MPLQNWLPDWGSVKRVPRFRRSLLAVCAAAVTLLPPLATPSRAQDYVDTALVVAVDVSNSVDNTNYKLQMEGIAAALEDPSVIEAIVGGPSGGILFSVVAWSSEPTIVQPWTKITSAGDAAAIATVIRATPRNWAGGEFTCLARMLRVSHDQLLPQMPMRANRTVIDVSGDGPDNCKGGESIASVRELLVGKGITINGLPILQADRTGDDFILRGRRVNAGIPEMKGPELEAWYKANVQGGPGSFILPANGFSDFGRAIRRKFVIEVSGAQPSDADRKRKSLAAAAE
ncbi:MAG: DUF1194 domain-containing protein [Hyphomicrobium sp.]|nr:DUF1194 domain-containing protein [Hyphomicrobium sp.]